MEAEEPAKAPISLVSCVLLILVIAAGLGVGSFFALRMINERRAAAEFVERIKLHDGVRPPDPSPDALDRALPALDAREGLRFFARPTFSIHDYAVAIGLGPDSAQGTILVFNRATRTLASRTFTLPPAAYRELAVSIDKALGEAETAPRFCADGVGYVIERSGDGRQRWGTNGESCPLRYQRVAAALRSQLARYAPGLDLPAQDNWSKAR